MKIIRQREHKAIMSSTSLLLSETNANDSSSHLTSMITSNTSLLPVSLFVHEFFLLKIIDFYNQTIVVQGKINIS